jgi:hypothetical protein
LGSRTIRETRVAIGFRKEQERLKLFRIGYLQHIRKYFVTFLLEEGLGFPRLLLLGKNENDTSAPSPANARPLRVLFRCHRQ